MIVSIVYLKFALLLILDTTVAAGGRRDRALKAEIRGFKGISFAKDKMVVLKSTY